MTADIKIIETITCAANGQTRQAELRDEGTTLEGTPLWSIWFAGDQTGKFTRQLQGNPDQIKAQWAKIKTMEVK